ncbi:flavodoxin [Pseudomonas sp. CFBP 13711]|uniref:flavodoxin n=1 Tax=unclassified Pseudomonas TaxID=196821 RepID=UPI001780AD3F|nr:MULTISPECIES: flavodoxin [unclassified Pseudomonas]MBD8707177.1 flavodoxin [Pseudomonas sp. CFBP 13711]MBD8714799.1 flavodoxin [Pseudomonas sp. CFBP 13715]
MPLIHDPVRRKVVAALASLPLLGASITSHGKGGALGGSKVLVAYFTRSGNTEVVAGLLQRAQQADLFEIAPADAYPKDYLATVEQARRERDSNFEPLLAAHVSHIADYDLIFLGFPIWGETTPPVIRSFLSSHDLSGKVLVPFITHGGYGIGSSYQVLTRHAPGAVLQKGFEMQADQERKTMDQVNGWLKDIQLPA